MRYQNPSLPISAPEYPKNPLIFKEPPLGHMKSLKNLIGPLKTSQNLLVTLEATIEPIGLSKNL